MKEYGGYLPLELNDTGEYYQFEGNKMQAFNSGRTAIYFALKNLSVNKVFIPHYICDTVVEAALKAGVEIERYFIDKNFMPNDVNIEDNECILIVNYFGLFNNEICEIIKGFNNVIIDNTQAFFNKPIFRDGCMNVYSCRKFIGVSDGGYLIGNNLKDIECDLTYSGEFVGHLIKSIEFGTNFAYGENKENEKLFSYITGAMSKLTKSILKNADYERIKTRRVENFNYLHNKLKDVNNIHIKKLYEDNVPYCYPFLVDKDLKEAFISNKIYVPTLWQEVLEKNLINRFENTLSKYLLIIPVDQRYSLKDMEDMYLLINDILTGAGIK